MSDIGNKGKKEEEETENTQNVSVESEIMDKPKTPVSQDESDPVKDPTTPSPVIPNEVKIPELRDGFVSAMSVDHSPEKQYLTLSFDKNLRIPVWSNHRDFWKSLYIFFVKLITFYDGIVLNVPKVDNDLNNDLDKTTMRTKMGYNPEKLKEHVRSADIAKITGMMRLMKSWTDEGDVMVDHIATYAYPGEIELQLLFSDWNKKANLHEIGDIKKYFQLLNNGKNVVNVLPPQFNPQYDKIWLPKVTNLYTVLMDTVPEFREEILIVMRQQTLSSISFEASQHTTFKELLNSLNISTNRFSSTASLPISITSADGQLAYNKLITTLVAGRWSHLVYPSADINTFDVAVLLECIMMKLFIPGRAFRERNDIPLPQCEEIMRIDNYIYKWFILQMKQYTNGNRKGKKQDLNDEDHFLGGMVDISQNNLADANVRPNAVPADVWNFLVTDRSGRGWGSAGNTNAVGELVDADGNDNASTFIINHHPDLHPAPILWRSTYGQSYWHSDVSILYPQLKNFVRFARALQNVSFYETYMQELKAIVNLVSRVANQASLRQKYAQYHERVSRYASLSPLSHVIADSHVDNEGLDLFHEIGEREQARLFAYNNNLTYVQKSPQQLVPGSFLALAFMSNFDMPLWYPSNHDNTMEGWHIHSEIRKFEELFDLAKTMIPEGIYKKSLGIETALSQMSGPVKNMLEKGLQNTERFTIPIIDNMLWIRKMNAIDEKLVKGKESLWGWVNRAFWMGVPKVEGELFDITKQSTLVLPRGVPDEYTVKDIYRMIDEESFKDALKRAVDKDVSIVWHLPIPIMSDTYSTQDLNSNVIDVEKGTLDIKPLKVSYIFNDADVRITSLRFAFMAITTFGTDMLDFRITDAETLAKFSGQHEVDRALRLWTPSIFTRYAEDRIVV